MTRMEVTISSINTRFREYMAKLNVVGAIHLDMHADVSHNILVFVSNLLIRAAAIWFVAEARGGWYQDNGFFSKK
jgi:hypothetical protein